MNKGYKTLLLVLMAGHVWAAAQPALVFNVAPASTTCAMPAGTYDITWQKDVAWPTARFTADNTGSCEIDHLTGLMWLKSPGATRYSWDASAGTGSAQAYVASLNAGNGTCGYTDWRLPNILELNSLVNYCYNGAPSAYLNSVGFTAVQAGNYWSSTPAPASGLNASYELDMSGNTGLQPAGQATANYVLPVRGGK